MGLLEAIIQTHLTDLRNKKEPLAWLRFITILNGDHEFRIQTHNLVVNGSNPTDFIILASVNFILILRVFAEVPLRTPVNQFKYNIIIFTCRILGIFYFG
jgi:hypothetical protein